MIQGRTFHLGSIPSLQHAIPTASLDKTNGLKTCCIFVQMVVEKLLAQEGLSRQELGRQEFEQRVWAWKEQYGGLITQQMCQLGASCDWTRERFTLDQGLSGAAPAISVTRELN